MSKLSFWFSLNCLGKSGYWDDVFLKAFFAGYIIGFLAIFFIGFLGFYLTFLIGCDFIAFFSDFLTWALTFGISKYSITDHLY